tara:strand:- start:232 stop:657 length:426 start_codon:yes stop_codon:yes gene_type:complete
MLPRLFGEEVLRTMANELLNEETDKRIIASLKEMAFDASLDGTEAQKNAQLAPSAPVPALDREVAEAQGQRVGLEPIRSLDTPVDGQLSTEKTVQSKDKEAEKAPKKATTEPLYRAVTQDEMMGYDDDFDIDDSDDDEEYF